MPSSRHLRHVTLLLVAISTALVQVALASRQPGVGLGLLGVSTTLAIVLRAKSRRRPLSDVASTACVLALASLPIVWDLVSRGVARVGEPYEVQLAYVLRNAMFAVAAMPDRPRATQQAALASFFLVIFGFLWSDGTLAIALLVSYAILGAWWLLAAYWDHLGGRFADSSQRSIPVRPGVAALGALGLGFVACLPLARWSAATTALAGFFPSSGGTQWNDPFANGGVGDGDQMVAAKDRASSFGPIDSELFLESQMPSLYDAINEFSEADPIRKKRVQRAIPLAAMDVQDNHEKRGTTQQAGREFSTVRQQTTRTPKTEDRLSASLLLVKGRTPLHLALETYDRWDGSHLLASASDEPLRMILRDADKEGHRWLHLGIARPTDVFSAKASTQVRVVNLKTDRVPTPGGVRRVTLDGLHAARMFDYAADGSLSMDAPHVPQLTIFEFQNDLRGPEAQPNLARSEPANEEGPIADLAREWTRGVPVGWRQVRAVVNRLRSDYTHDPEAMVPAEADDSVEYFLCESKRGPDYLFAASAAVMLRSLGYDTRVRSGFYADPRRYERRADLTPVLAEDAHFWVEVLTSNGYRTTERGVSLPGVWVTVEPTPGFRVLYAPETLLARIRRAGWAVCRSMAAHPFVVGLTLIGLGAVVAHRRRLLDAALLAWWTLRSSTRDSDRLARRTLRLVEWRAWLHRQKRPPGTPLGRWTALRSHDDFLALVSWALYGPGAPAPLPTDAAQEACRRVIRTPFDLDNPPGAAVPDRHSMPPIQKA